VLGSLHDRLRDTPARSWLEPLSEQVAAVWQRGHGNLLRWQQANAALPDLHPSAIDLRDAVRVGMAADASEEARDRLRSALQDLHPWRKGPFELFGVQVDAEWRSDWKWNRLRGEIASLRDRLVLDVGCGNGYYALRMVGAGARLAIGIDPSLLFALQFAAVRRYVGDRGAYVLPVGVESMSDDLAAFDTVFSMGVLYHRRDYREHLRQLYGALRPGGELVLETLVLADEAAPVLVPEGRYAQMRNVWAIPSCPTLLDWLRASDFRDGRIVAVARTTVAEQRATEWMRFHSLANFLDPHDPTRTLEGHPAPVRAVAIARR